MQNFGENHPFITLRGNFSSNLIIIILLMNLSSILWLFFVQICAAYRILFFAPGYGKSQTIFYLRVANVIAQSGYEVVTLEPDFYMDPALISPISYSDDAEGRKHPLYKRHILRGFKDKLANLLEPNAYNKEIFDYTSAYEEYELIFAWRKILLPACELLIKRNDLFAYLRKFEFNAIFYEPITLCGAGIGHLLGIKTQILLMSNILTEYAANLMGLPFPASHVPGIIYSRSQFNEEMSYFDRINNIFAVYLDHLSFAESEEPHTAMFRKHFGSKFPNLVSLAQEAALCFSNTNDFLEYPRPYQLNIVNIGGIGLSQIQPLDPIILEQIQKGKDGVILISLVTHTSTRRMATKFVANILVAICKFPKFQFIMKVDSGELESMKKLALQINVTNIFFTDWIQQPELLAHENVRLFISHVGYQSFVEAAFNGVPILGIPFFGNQYRNANLLMRNGWGLRVDRQLIYKNSKYLSDGIEKILNSPIYAKNALRTKQLIRNQALTAEERLKTHLDLLLIYGGGDLPEWKNVARKMSNIRYFNLDIWMPLFIGLQCFLHGLTKFLVWLYKRLLHG